MCVCVRVWGVLHTFADITHEYTAMVLTSLLSLAAKQFCDYFKRNFKAHSCKQKQQKENLYWQTKRLLAKATEVVVGISADHWCFPSRQTCSPNLLWIKWGRLSGFRSFQQEEYRANENKGQQKPCCFLLMPEECLDTADLAPTFTLNIGQCVQMGCLAIVFMKTLCDS